MSDDALTRYRHRLRRQRLIYATVVGAVVLALAVVARVAWTHGEIAHTTLHTVRRAPADLAPSTPSATQTLAWRTSEAAATGDPRWRGTVVVYGRHTVRGVDARTGVQTWSYSRSDRTVCAVAQLNGTAVAFYDLAGNCDEVTALDSGTGVRLWTRTLDEDGHPLFGHPQLQTYSDNSTGVLVTTASVIYAISLDAGSAGEDHFFYAHFGCAIQHAVLGSAGLLVSQDCTAPRCGQLKFCGKGPQLFLRTDVTDGQDSDHATNPDRITWNRIGDADRPVSADGVISAYDASTGALEVIDGAKGASAGSVTLARGPTVRSGGTITASPTTSGGPEVVWIGGISYAVTRGEVQPRWTAPTLGPPTVSSPDDAVPADLDRIRVTVAARDGVQVRNGSTGAVLHAYRVTRPATGAAAYPLGVGFLVAGSTGTLAYR